MAVNENLYSWMLKTYGMGAAEWYRSNPTRPSGSNPFLPRGAYVPQAKRETPEGKGPRGETLASVSPDIIEESVVEPASAVTSSFYHAFVDIPEESYERLRSQYAQNPYQYESEATLKQQFPGATYKKVDIPTYANIEISDYGMGYRDIGSGAHYLFHKYLEDPVGKSLRDDYTNRIYPAFKNTPASSEAAYNALVAESKQNQQAQIALARQYNTLYSGKPVEGWDANKFYATVDLPTRQNLQILVQQSKQGITASQEFLNDYMSKGEDQGVPETGPRGEEVEPARGPRGEDMGEIARNQGPSTPVKYDEDMNMFVPNQGGGRPTNIRLKNPPVREAQAPAFDEQKALIAAQAAGSYRNRGDVEDPFRSAAFG
jgi:hypothetical protein